MSTEQTETKRDRVRRLVIDPLRADGFRMRHGTPEAEERKQLDRIADRLAYMDDDALRAMRRSLASMGDGAARTFWPRMATVIALAEAFQPRPVEEIPELARWFGSRAGAAAMADDRLVAEFVFFDRHKRPPLTDQDRSRVAQKAADWGRRLQLIREREARGQMPTADDAQFLAWHDRMYQRAAKLVHEGETARATGDAA